VRIDHTHTSWLVASLAILGVAALLYAIYRVPPAGGSMGGTAIGLLFGIVAFGFMIFAALLGARKKVPVWRVGRAQSWMRGHLWLGLLSLPLVLFHAGFRYGHGVTAALTTLLILVVASGVFGAALQHFMPRVITSEVPMETIYEEIGHVREQLRVEAKELVAKSVAGAAPAKAEAAEDAPVAAVTAGEEQAAPLQAFFEREIEPFLANPAGRGHALANPGQARGAFVQLRKLVPPELHTTIDDLENICEEERQLSRQARLHLWLHGWLLLHVPLSLALILLGAIHAVMALRY
jgi:hypothetical protein